MEILKEGNKSETPLNWHQSRKRHSKASHLEWQKINNIFLVRFHYPSYKLRSLDAEE